MVMACLYGNLEECIVVRDAKGPYNNYQQCIARANEMRLFLLDQDPPWFPVRYECVKQKVGA